MSNFQSNCTPLDTELLNKKLDEIEKEIIDEDKINKRYELVILDDLLKIDFGPIKWLVEGLIPIETITFLSGVPASFKTWTILELAIKIANGGLLFNKFKTTKLGILIVDEENGLRWLKDRLLKFPGAKNLPIYFLSGSMFTITQESIKRLTETAKEKSIGVIIFDSFVRVHGARDENDAVQISQVFKLTKQLTNSGLTVIFTHHHRKESFPRKSNPSQDMRGSSDILAAIDTHLAIERDGMTLKFSQPKSRHILESKPFTVKVVSTNNEMKLEYEAEIDEEKTLNKNIKEAIIDYLQSEDKPLFKKELFEALKSADIEGGWNTFKAVVKEMVNNGELFEKKGERNKTFISLKPFEEKTIDEQLKVSEIESAKV